MSLRSCVVLLALALPLPSYAATVTWVFEGTVEGTFAFGGNTPTEVPELTSLGVVVGTPFVATFTLDTGIADSLSSSSFGQYDGAVLGATFTAASYSVGGSGPRSNSVLFIATQQQVAHAAYGLGNCTPCTYTAPDLSLPLEALETTDVFASDAFPDQFPALSSLEPFQHPPNPALTNGFGSFIVVHGGSSYLLGSLSQQYTVPEPLLTGCLGAALLSLAVLRRRRA